jgi:hypothetical protein
MLTGFASLSTLPIGPLWWPVWAKAVTICACILDGWRPWEGCTDCYNLGLEYDWDPSPPLDPNP